MGTVTFRGQIPEDDWRYHEPYRVSLVNGIPVSEMHSLAGDLSETPRQVRERAAQERASRQPAKAHVKPSGAPSAAPR